MTIYRWARDVCDGFVPFLWPILLTLAFCAGLACAPRRREIVRPCVVVDQPQPTPSGRTVHRVARQARRINARDWESD